MDKLPPKQPNFFDNVNKFGQYKYRYVSDYFVDSSRPKEKMLMKWEDGGPFIDDVIQGGIGDCWLISSIRSILETGKMGKENIKNIFKYAVTKKDKNKDKNIEVKKVEYVVLRMFPITLYVEKNKDNTLFKIVSIPKRTPVEIHVNVGEDNMIKELGEERYKNKNAGAWVKYIEMGFKEFYRKKYISFVGDEWKQDITGANYIYRHLNDALMGLRTAKTGNKKIQNNIEYGYPFVGASVLSGKKMESSWMDVAMGHGENDNHLPKTQITKKQEKEVDKNQLNSKLINRGKEILKTLCKLKRYAYFSLFPGDYGLMRYDWDGTDSEIDKKHTQKTWRNNLTEIQLEDIEDQNVNLKKIVTKGRKMGINTRIRPSVFVRTDAGGSHVVRLKRAIMPKGLSYSQILSSDENKIKNILGSVILSLINTNGDSYLYESLIKILEKDPTFNIVYEKIQPRSVKKYDIKRKYNINEK